MRERSVLCDVPRCGMSADGPGANDEQFFGPQSLQHGRKPLFIS